MAAKIGLATLARIEQREGPRKGHTSTIISIQAALERAGVRFTEDEHGGFGVRLDATGSITVYVITSDKSESPRHWNEGDSTGSPLLDSP